MQSDDERDVTWQLTADQVTSLNDAEVLEARGNVTLRRGADYLKADFARYYITTKWVFLQGNVEAMMGKDTLKAREAEFDLRSRVGWLKKGEVFMDGPHIYFAGDRINKHYGDVYTFKEAKVTACDDDVPAWSITADEAVVEIDGYAQLWRSKFQLKDTAVMYMPWLIVPAKRERQSGFLTPEFGRNNRVGAYINVPYFWAIDQKSDLTVNEYFMEKRGLMQGIQYRAAPSANEFIWLRADYLSDGQRITSDSHDPVNDEDGLVRTNTNRYWLRGMVDLELPGAPNWKLRGDLDYVSDQNYLHEFKNGMSGFRSSQEELFDIFRRDLRERDNERKSAMVLLRDWDRFSVALSAAYIQDQTLGNGNRIRSSDTTVQQGPSLAGYLYQGQIIQGFPLELSASADASYMYRRKGTRGSRYEITPVLTLPLTSEYGSFIATAGVRQAIYRTDQYFRSPDGKTRETGDNQTVPHYSLSGSTEFFRVFNLASDPLTATEKNIGKSEWTALRHSIQPRLTYRYIPLEDQERNPRYSSEDRILPKDELVYSISTVVTRKRESVTAKAAPDASGKGVRPQPSLATDYLDVLRLTVEQGYDFREASRRDERERYPRRPYSDIKAEIHAAWDERFTLINRTFWSAYTNKINRQDHGIRFNLPGWGSLYTGLDYRRAIREYTREREDAISSFVLRGSLTSLGPLSLNFGYRRDYEKGKDVERSLELVYNHQCFQLIGRALSEAGEVDYQLMFVLSGLGS